MLVDPAIRAVVPPWGELAIDLLPSTADASSSDHLRSSTRTNDP